MSLILRGPAKHFDAREWFAGPDVVELALAGEVGAVRYVDPRPLVCTVPQVMLRAAPDAAAPAVSALLHGEAFEIADTRAGPAGEWALGRCLADRYIGWAPLQVLALPGGAATHRLIARRAPLFSDASIKAPVLAELPHGALLRGTLAGDFLAVAGGGHVHIRHIAALDALPRPDRFATAALFAGAPYLWGGRTPDGVDCSGLVQAALAGEGIACPRDSDQQANMGAAIAWPARQAGDIICWPGHVGLLLEDDLLCHANAHWMAVVTEPLADVVARAGGDAAVRRVGV
jgi:hypothetical protein